MGGGNAKEVTESILLTLCPLSFSADNIDVDTGGRGRLIICFRMVTKVELARNMAVKITASLYSPRTTNAIVETINNKQVPVTPPKEVTSRKKILAHSL